MSPRACPTKLCNPQSALHSPHSRNQMQSLRFDDKYACLLKGCYDGYSRKGKGIELQQRVI